MKHQKFYIITQIVSLLNSDYMAAYTNYGGNITGATYDIVYGFSSKHITVIYDSSIDDTLLTQLSTLLFTGIVYSVLYFNVTDVEQQEQYFSYLHELVKQFEGTVVMHFCNTKMLEYLMIELNERNFIRRNLIYLFYWGKIEIDYNIMDVISDTMKIVIITNPRYNVYRLYFNQATSLLNNELKLVNWWINGAGLYQHPTLPDLEKIFRNFNGRVIDVPVINKPPWHFVYYGNDSMVVLGGRDDKLISILASKLNFQYKYFDPPERTQGSSFDLNGTFEGVLGLIWKREAEFFIGDVALTSDRFQAVEFTFFTLADSGAFVTHAPNKLNEAFSLIRPFRWEVWPAIAITLLICGPILYLLIAAPNAFHPQFIVGSQLRLFLDCVWYTIGLFLKQTGKEPGTTHKVRFFIIIIYLSATYVISDMYSANLTSLLARPGREKAINNLLQLEKAMINKDFQLYVEHYSSSYSLLENGTGIYGRLWYRMNANQESFLVDSVEDGVQMVKEQSNVALMAGRETLYFDIQRFGANNFHLSQKLNTAYSAIALQIGCPYIKNFNQILMALFEAGILTKITENEYERSGRERTNNMDIDHGSERLEKVDGKTATNNNNNNDINNKKKNKNEEDDRKLEPINIKMLQGAFYLLIIGYLLSGLDEISLRYMQLYDTYIYFVGISLCLEIYYHRKIVKNAKKISKKLRNLLRKKRKIFRRIRKGIDKIQNVLRDKFNEAVIRTLDYID